MSPTSANSSPLDQIFVMVVRVFAPVRSMAFLAVFLHDIFVSIDIEFIRFNGWIKETGQYGKSVNLIKVC